MVGELTRNETCTKLKLIEYLTAEGVDLRVAGNVVVACCEFNYSIIVARLVVDGLCCAILRGDNLSLNPALGVVEILDCINQRFRGYDVIIEINITLGSANNSAFLILIIYN